MLYLSEDSANQVVSHSRREASNEACGILAGKDGKVEKVYEMTNRDKTETTFFMEPEEQLKVMKEIRNLGMEMVGIYHSHPATQAYPSAHDVELAFYPESSYVIISLIDKDKPQIRSFNIIEGKITEEEVKIQK